LWQLPVWAPINVTGSDPDGDDIVITKASFPSHCTLEGMAPNFIYTPDVDYQGNDAFQFHVWDGLQQSTATVSVTVENIPPVANDDEAVVLAGSNTLIDVLSNDEDTSALTITNLTQPAGGTGSVSIQSGQVQYQANPGTGEVTDSFTYQADDGEDLSNVATVTVQLVEENGTYDGDADGVPDGWELARYTSTAGDGTLDFDEDGITDGAEFASTRNPAGIDRVALTFADDFDTRGPGLLSDYPDLWSMDGTGSLTLADGIGLSATRALEFITESGQTLAATQYLEQTFEPAVWTDFQATLATYANDAEAPELDPEATVAFYLTEAGDVLVRNGSTWENLGLSLDTANSHRYTVKQDFVAQEWELWIDGMLVTDPPLTFAASRNTPHFLRFSLESSNSAWVDAIVIRRNAPAGLQDLATYSDWQGGINWNGEDDSVLGDPNNNGLSNLLEYSLGFIDPVSGTQIDGTAPLQQTMEGTPMMGFTYRYNQEADDVYRKLASPSLTLRNGCPKYRVAACGTAPPRRVQAASDTRLANWRPSFFQSLTG